MTYAQKQDGVWRELRPTLPVIASDGRQASWDTFMSLSVLEQEAFGGFVVPEPVTPAGKTETARFLKPDGARPSWAPQYVDTPAPVVPVKTVPEIISDRQFAQVIAKAPYNTITQQEAKDWASRGQLPDQLIAALQFIPEENDQRFDAEMALSSATTFERNHPYTPLIGQLLGFDDDALDDIWTRGAAIP